MINRVIIVGRITNDLEIKRTQTSMAILRFSVAVDGSTKDSNGERKTNFIPVVAFGKNAETIEKYFSKGRMIALEGSLSQNRYERKDGSKATSIEVILSGFSFCDSNKNLGNKSSEVDPNLENNGYQSDIPSSSEDEIDYSKLDLADDDLPF